MAKWSKVLASHQEVSGLRTALGFFSFKFFKKFQIFSQFVPVPFCVLYSDSGVHSYQFHCVPSTPSLILKSLVPVPLTTVIQGVSY